MSEATKSAGKQGIRVREQFLANLANGSATVGLEFNEDQGTYLLEPYED
jgi:hypothetical protein